MTRKQNVAIKAQNVQVVGKQTELKSNGPKTKRSRNRKRRGNKNEEFHDAVAFAVPKGVGTGLSRLAPTCLSDVSPFSEQAAEFIKNYVDPLGEHVQSMDSARVPDGALQNSAGAFVRSVVTVVPPWLQVGTTDLEGKTGSFLVLQAPMFRTLAIIIGKELDGEFDEATMTRFTTTFAKIFNRESAIYPQWIELGDGTHFEYMTIIDSTALRNVIPPNESGVSGTIDSYRQSSGGVEVYFNTPDLFDQGTVTSMRYPANISTKTTGIDIQLAGSNTLYWEVQQRRNAAGDAGVVVEIRPTFDGGLQPFLGTRATLPSAIFTSPRTIRNATNTFNVVSGVGYQYTLEAGEIRVVNIIAPTTNFMVIGSTIGSQIGDATNDSTRVYALTATGGGVGESVSDVEMTVMALPPVTQAAMYQQNPKTVINLLKDTEGVYLPSCIFEPVFKVTHASEYRKCLFLTPDSPLIEMLDPDVGWYDTVDANMGISVINMQSVPYACKLMLKLAKSFEIVPSDSSIVGLFTTGCPALQSEAVDVVKAFTDYQPHGYPVTYNGLGKLFSRILRVTEAIPLMLRSGMNLSREVKRVCDLEALEASDDEDANIVAQRPVAKKRVARRK